MLLCVLCWSTSGLFIKWIDWHPLVISCVRSAIAAAFMAAVSGKTMFAAAARKGTPRIFGVNALVFAAFMSAGTKIFYVAANKLTSPANAILLQHSAPVWAALVSSLFLRDRLSRPQWAATVMAVCGAGIFFLDGMGSGGLAGDGLALLAGFTFALSMIALGLLKDSSPGLALFFSHIISVLIGLPFVFIAPPEFTPKNIAAIFFLGIVQIGCASLLYAYAIRCLSAINTMLIAQLEPVLNPVWVFIFLGEMPTGYALAGGAVIIASVIVCNYFPSTFSADRKRQKISPVNPACFFPMFLPIAGKRILIIGGGSIALRRVQTLLRFDCRIDIIAPHLHSALDTLSKEHRDIISVERRTFSPGGIRAAPPPPDETAAEGSQREVPPFFVLAATNNREINHAIALECAGLGIPVSVADKKEESTFFFPAIAIHDTIIAGISSGGLNHGAVREAAQKIRKTLENGK
jgi:drug/metabolite transporter (DMT)-like permease/siroheme synthase (precorrin-2 oxidase/ferrochelatase)